MIFEHINYRAFLKATLAERVQKNPSYSLRAMAKQLGFSSSQLSEAMSGKANFSSQSLRKIAKSMQLKERESEYLMLLGELEAQKDPEIREGLLRHLQRCRPGRRPIQDLSVDSFRQISEWYHSPILELAYLEGFEFTVENAAKKVRITKLEAELAIERLLRLELLERNDDGTFRLTNQCLQIRSPEKNAAMRKFYRQMMEKASQALDEQDPQTERWSGYETLAVASEAQEELRSACDEFFEKMIQIARKYPAKKDVDHLFIHFFNLTPSQEKGSKGLKS
jgi:uncharacterized protein (TIGR02147 family)